MHFLIIIVPVGDIRFVNELAGDSVQIPAAT